MRVRYEIYPMIDITMAEIDQRKIMVVYLFVKGIMRLCEGNAGAR